MLFAYLRLARKTSVLDKLIDLKTLYSSDYYEKDNIPGFLTNLPKQIKDNMIFGNVEDKYCCLNPLELTQAAMLEKDIEKTVMNLIETFTPSNLKMLVRSSDEERMLNFDPTKNEIFKDIQYSITEIPTELLDEWQTIAEGMDDEEFTKFAEEKNIKWDESVQRSRLHMRDGGINSVEQINLKKLDLADNMKILFQQVSSPEWLKAEVCINLSVPALTLAKDESTEECLEKWKNFTVDDLDKITSFKDLPPQYKAIIIQMYLSAAYRESINVREGIPREDCSVITWVDDNKIRILLKDDFDLIQDNLQTFLTVFSNFRSEKKSFKVPQETFSLDHVDDTGMSAFVNAHVNPNVLTALTTEKIMSLLTADDNSELHEVFGPASLTASIIGNVTEAEALKLFKGSEIEALWESILGTKALSPPPEINNFSLRKELLFNESITSTCAPINERDEGRPSGFLIHEETEIKPSKIRSACSASLHLLTDDADEFGRLAYVLDYHYRTFFFRPRHNEALVIYRSSENSSETSGEAVEQTLKIPERPGAQQSCFYIKRRI